MPRKTPRVPAYRRHSSGQARVTLNGKDHLLGPFNSPESHEEYRRLVREWLDKHGKPGKEPEQGRAPLSVNEVILAYWKHAAAYYHFDGRRGDEACLRDALRVLKSLYGRTQAREFGPKALKACRSEMVARGWSRTYVNAQVDRVRRMFRWAAEEELLPGSVSQDLRTVASLRAGKTAARETTKVRPVSQEHVEATLPRLPPTVRAMVRLQQLTACRPAEVCVLRPMDLDRANPGCWIYRPGSDQGAHGAHKTAHHGHERLVFLGPRAQEVLRPFLDTRGDAYCFSPAGSEAARATERRGRRETPLYPSHLERRERERKARRGRAPRDRYDTHSYRRAIARACDLAFPPPGHLAQRAKESAREWRARLTPEQRADLRRWRKEHRWSPNRLRHSRATELRPYGLDVAKTVLGHSKVETTEVYAEKDLAAAMELMGRIG